MHISASLAFAISAAILFVTPSLGHAHQARRHHVHRQGELAHRDLGEINLYKRFENARFTYYAVGLGACGGYNQPNDFVVALDAAQFSGGMYCYQTISITANGKTATAQIVDECGGCPYGGLDFSQGLFEYFADTSAGVLSGTWNFGSGGSAPSPSPSPSPSPQPTTSAAIPLTSWLPPVTTSQPPATSATSAPHTTNSPTPSLTSGSSNSSSVPTQTATDTVAVTPAGAANLSVLFDLTLSMVDIGAFLGACSGM